MGLVFWVPIATEFKNIFEIHHIVIKEFFYFKHFLKQFAKQYIFFFSYTTHWFSYTTHWFSYTTHWFSYTTQWFSYRSYFSIVSIIVFDISLNIVSMCYIFLKTSNTHLFSNIFDIFFFTSGQAIFGFACPTGFALVSAPALFCSSLRRLN